MIAARLVRILSACCALAICASSLAAQQIQAGAAVRREIRGIVTDSASRGIPDVTVTVTETGLSTATDSAGRYHLAGSLPPTVTIFYRRIGLVPTTKRADLSHGNVVLDVKLASSAFVLGSITVKADSAAKFLDAQQATATMTQQEVQEKRGQTLGETIKALPGVAVIQYGPSIAKPVVRGLHSQRIATVNAGVPQEGQQWGVEHAPEIDAFAANEIEVIRGPGTILYGSGALGGVVLVQPRPLPTSGSVDGEITTNAFSNNRQGAGSLLIEGADLKLPWLGQTGWRAQVSGRRAGDAETPSYFLPNTGFKELNFNAALGIVRPWGSSEINASHFGTRLGLYVGAHVGNLDDLNRAMQTPYTTSSFAYTIGHPDQSVSHDFVAWRTNLALPKDSKLEVSYGFQHNNRKEFDNHGFAVGGNRPAFQLELYTHSLDVHYHHPQVGPFSGTIGLSGLRQGNLSPGRSFLIPQYRLYAGGLFAVEEFSWRRLSFNAGARVDDRWQHAYQFGAPVIVSPDDQQNYVGFSGSLGASLKLSQTWSLAGTLGRAWRPPNVNERFSQGVHHGTAQYEIGDSTLVPERSFNADATLRHLGARSRLELSAYSNHIDGYIFLRPRTPIATVRGIYPAYNYAHTDARIQGFEVTGQLDPWSWVSLYANANVLRGTDLPTGYSLYDMPADRVSTSARVFGSSSSRVVSPYVEIGATIVRKQDYVPPVTIYKLPTAGYALYNAEIGASSLTVGHTRIEPSLAMRNVFNKQYRDYLSRYRLFVDEPGRDVVLRFTVPFGAARE
jgi:iron complex outermembrane receptor protein